MAGGAGLDPGITWHSDKPGADETAVEIRQLGRVAMTARLTPGLSGCGDVIEAMSTSWTAVTCSSSAESRLRAGSCGDD